MEATDDTDNTDGKGFMVATDNTDDTDDKGFMEATDNTDDTDWTDTIRINQCNKKLNPPSNINFEERSLTRKRIIQYCIRVIR